MKSAFRGAAGALALLCSMQLIAAPESWQAVELPGEATIVGMGELPFPDGVRAAWIGTDEGSFRRVDGQWQRWPQLDGQNSVLRDMLVAVNEDGLTAWWLATPEGLLLTRNGEDWTRWSQAETGLIDDDILALDLGQSSDGRPEVWIGSRSGLTIWRLGEWEAVLARPDGFHGGEVNAIRSLFHNGRQQTWAAGPDGLSRYQDGRWQRWVRACLRGHRISAIQTIDAPGGMVMLAGTDRGLWQLSLDDPETCQLLTGPDAAATPVLGLARDRHEQLYVFTPRQVERFSPNQRDPQGWGWTFFDTRDGLPERIEWQRARRLDGDGRLWVGSNQGAWRLDIASPPGAPERPPVLRLSDGESVLDPGSESPLRFGQGRPRLEILPPQASRPHALRFRLRTSAEAEFGSWQAGTELQTGSLAYGRHELSVEMSDEFGRVHGPYEFSLQRTWPTAMIAAAVAALLAILALIGWSMGRRNKR